MAGAQSDASQITLVNYDNLLNMDPALLTSGADYAVAVLVYSGLVRHKPGTTDLEGDLPPTGVSTMACTTPSISART